MKYPLMKNNILPSDLEPVIDLLKEKDPRLTSGHHVAEFEKKWSEWLGIKYSIFVNSGSSSNLLSIAYLKEKYPDGGKIIVPPFTWSSDISSIIWMGFEPIFVDIRLETLGLNSDEVIKKFENYNDIKAIFITHAQGFNALDQILMDFIKKNNIFLIEDVCESHGSILPNGKKAGSYGDISCFSFYYAHHLSTIEGGMICTNNHEIYQIMRMLRSHGMVRECTSQIEKEKWIKSYPDLNEKFIFTRAAFNVRNNEIGALIGIKQLDRLDTMISKRSDNFRIFLENLPEWCFKDFILEGQSNYAFNLILKEPDNTLMNKLRQQLNDNEIEFRQGSAGGGNQLRQPYVKDILKYTDNYIKSNYPVTDHIHFYGMYLGNYPTLSKLEILEITSVINSI